MKEGLNVRGLNTAATLWCSAAVGAACGTGFLGEAVLLTVAVLCGNTLLRPLVNAINRIPIDERASEATYEVRLTTEAENVAAVRDALGEALERASYPVRDIEVEERGEDEAELVATLVSTAIEPPEIDAVVAELGRRRDVTHATWIARTSD